jgi:hypothetical protein
VVRRKQGFPAGDGEIDLPVIGRIRPGNIARRSETSRFPGVGLGDHDDGSEVMRGSIDLNVAQRARSSLCWRPTVKKIFNFNELDGAPGRTRTADPLITNQLLYQLSYKGTRGVIAASRIDVQIHVPQIHHVQRKGFAGAGRICAA